MLLEKGYYDPDDEMDRHLLAFVFIPVIQKEMDIQSTLSLRPLLVSDHLP